MYKDKTEEQVDGINKIQQEFDDHIKDCNVRMESITQQLFKDLREMIQDLDTNDFELKELLIDCIIDPPAFESNPLIQERLEEITADNVAIHDEMEKYRDEYIRNMTKLVQDQSNCCDKCNCDHSLPELS